jgi:hypothetical protein
MIKKLVFIWQIETKEKLHESCSTNEELAYAVYEIDEL